jgi:hypothetical protein
MKLPMNDGTTYEWSFLHPAALLYYTCSVCNVFARMLYKAGPVGNIVLNADEFTPGNVLRPDSGRCTWGIYWTMREWSCEKHFWLNLLLPSPAGIPDQPDFPVPG